MPLPTLAAPSPRRLPLEPVATGLLAATWVASTFAAAGTVRWLAGWLYVVVVASGVGAHRAFVATANPGALVRRARIGACTKKREAVWLAVLWPLMLATPVVAGISIRRLGHPELPPWTTPLGSVLFAAAMSLSALALAANPPFERSAILRRRCAALMLWSLSSPLLLRSSLAFLPAAAAAAWVAVRSVLEDRMLRAERAGADGPGRRVRSRLVPGLW